MIGTGEFFQKNRKKKIESNYKLIVFWIDFHSRARMHSAKEYNDFRGEITNIVQISVPWREAPVLGDFFDSEKHFSVRRSDHPPGDEGGTPHHFAFFNIPIEPCPWGSSWLQPSQRVQGEGHLMRSTRRMKRRQFPRRAK